ncbi:MAG: hypothetical protein COV45_03545 [Deltaproteobacteria bacterium CG11_big_fil_rev_8_21_14_0_20_47_16]|nr:MAG: hypothetical protein COV45_03545 [Deltaproteobacteria bacterium CG11_big_fil_rev_8_21_14_0_20_47_16]
MKKRTIVALLALAFVSCISRIERDPGILVRNLMDDPAHLNPYTNTSAYASQVYAYIYESLLVADNTTLAPKPWIATSWEVSPDGLSYTFHMRHDVTWSDGKPLTADDVLFSVETMMNPKVDAAAQRSGYKDLDHVEKIDDYTVRFVFKRLNFRAFEMAGYLTIIPKHVFGDGHDFNTHPANFSPIGSGPFVLAGWERGRYVNLRRNDQYWNHEHLPRLKGIQYVIIPDSNTSFQYLKKGGMDYSDNLRSVQWVRQTESAKFKERFKKYKFFPPGLAYIGWNEKKPFFADRRVRQAMTMMLDRQKIVDKLQYGQAMLVSGPGYYFGVSYDRSIQPWPYDSKRAVQLLDAAGWIDHDGDGIRDKDGVPFRFELVYGSGSPTGDRVGTILREDLSQIGIDMTPRPLEFSALIKMILAKDFDATFLGWSGGFPESDHYQLFHSSQIDGGSNNISFSNKEADRLMEQIRATIDPNKRKELHYMLHALLHEEEPYTFVYLPPALAAVDRRFTDVTAYPMGFDITEWGFKPVLRYME